MKILLIFLALIITTMPNNTRAANRAPILTAIPDDTDIADRVIGKAKRRKLLVSIPTMTEASEAPSRASEEIQDSSLIVYPLHQAARDGDVEAMQKLLANIYVNSLDQDARTALHWASERGHADVVQLLLVHGAHTKFSDCKNKQAKDLTETQVIRDLIKSKDDFCSAAYECHERALEHFLQKGAAIYINTQDLYGSSPLHFAVWNNKPNMARLLLQVPGININAQDCWGGTPLHDAASFGYIGGIELLLAHGADISIPDKYGRLAKDVAANEATRQLIAAHN